VALTKLQLRLRREAEELSVMSKSIFGTLRVKMKRRERPYCDWL